MESQETLRRRQLNQPTPPLERRCVVVRGQQLNRLENRTHRDDSRLTMKHILITTIAAVVLVGCGESQQSAPPVEAKPEPPTVKAPDISIHSAAFDENIEAVKQHLAAGTDVNAKDKGDSTPLHYASMMGHKEIVELLITKGADVNAKDHRGVTPLYDVAHRGHKEIAELLITAGADVNAKDKLLGRTPLDEAIFGNHSETAALLRKHGAK